jgi:multiple sugar transport system ATP-binding protein
MIALEDVTKRYGDDAAVDRLSLRVSDGEFMVLVGPSGSGKSTVLRLLAGLTKPDSGRVLIGERDVTYITPQERDVAMVFQSYALYPHMSVRQNLEFGLRLRNVPRGVRERRVGEVARMLDIEPLLDRRPAALSGGQRQRIAMGRAIIREPQAFLLDEPLSNLDAQLRVQVRAELVQLRDRLRTTTVYVTHDQVEAMTLGDRVAVLHLGRLQQVDTARGLYERPANIFVARFIGSPSMNIFGTRIEHETFTLGAHQLPLPATDELGSWGRRDLTIGIRPHAFEADGFSTDPDQPRIEVIADAVEDLGSQKILLFRLEDGHGLARFQAAVDARTNVRAGDTLRLAVDPDQLYFFHPETEAAIAWPRDQSQMPAAR